MNGYPPPQGGPPGGYPGYPPGHSAQAGYPPPASPGTPPFPGYGAPGGQPSPPTYQPPAGHQPPTGYQAPPPAPAKRGGGLARVLPVLMAVGFGLLGTAAVVAQTVFGIEIPIIGKLLAGGGSGGGPSAEAELKRLGVSYEAADPNAIVDKLEGRARKWRKDARFYALHINDMSGDGTIDFSSNSPTMTVEFFSPSLVGSASSVDYKKGIRKFVINHYKLDEQVWGVKEPVKDVPGTPIPKCKMPELMKTLASEGVTKSSKILVSLDPGFAFATKGLSLNVQSQNPKLHVYVDIDSCAIIKKM